MAIAGALTLPGATLLLVQVRGDGWRALFGVVLLWIIGSFALSGWRAIGVIADVHGWAAPPRDRILKRSGQDLATSRVERTAYLLRSAGYNSRFARLKVTLLMRARRHLLRAVCGLPVLMAVVIAYALLGPEPRSATASSARPIARPTPPRRARSPRQSPAGSPPARLSAHRAQHAPGTRAAERTDFGTRVGPVDAR